MNETPSEDGWSRVGQRLGSEDSASMKDYSDDIDSLLVLVSLSFLYCTATVLICSQDGLFSAVVTGFLVLAIAMLQEDTGQTSIQLLSRISDQLTSMTITPPYINSTSNGTLISSEPFEPTAAARWINSLWFLSLTLSLTSAVLGILAKQWIREYLKWNGSSSVPRENVLLRQIRTQAWEDWHATAIISSIPALLEIAIVLFVSGMAIFVWTLDLVVAKVVTASVGLFLLLITTLTFLPAAFIRCPYKSPTAWVIVQVVRLLARTCSHIAGLLSSLSQSTSEHTSEPSIVSQFNEHFKMIHSIAYLRPDTTPSWRLRDLQGAQLTELRDGDGHKTESSPILEEELLVELQGASDYLELRRSDRSSMEDTSNGHLSPAVLREFATGLGESDLLFKALVLFLAESPNCDALHHIAQCAQLMHWPFNCVPPYAGLTADLHLAEVVIAGGFRSLSAWYMLSRASSTGPAYMGPIITHPAVVSGRWQSTIATSILGALRRRILGLPVERNESCAFLPPEEEHADRIIEYEESPVYDSQHVVISYILVYGFDAHIAQMLSPAILDLPAEHPVIALLHRRAEELLCALRLITFYWDSSSPLTRISRHECAEVLANTFNGIVADPNKRRFDDKFLTLRSQIFSVLTVAGHPMSFTSGLALKLNPLSLGMPTVSVLHTMPADFVISYISAAPWSSASWLSLLAQYSLDVSTASREDIMLFALIVNCTKREVRGLSLLQVEMLCQIAISALRQAAFHGLEDAISILHEPWAGEPDQETAEDPDDLPICFSMLEW